MRPVVLGRRAARDLDDIWSHAAKDSIGAAEKVVDRVERAVRQLALTPGIGHQRRELRDHRSRVWSVYSYLLLYRFSTASALRL